MEPKPSIPFTDLPRDVLNQIFSYLDSTDTIGLTNKKLHNIVTGALGWFDQANKEIAAKFPPLSHIIQENESQSTNSVKLFMKVVNHLHDEAKLLGCNEEAPKEISGKERLEWECEHFLGLIKNVENEYIKRNVQQTKARDFKNFVEKVALEMNVDVDLQEINDSENTSLKDGKLFLDPQIKLQDDYNHIVWKALLENPRIHDIESLSFENVSFLPPEIAQIPNLVELSISEPTDSFVDLPFEVEKLKLLALTINIANLKEFPANICKLTNLQYLCLSSCQLESIPPEIANLKALTDLNLSYNQLTMLPADFSTLNLIRLSLSLNEFDHLPPEICELKELESLFLIGNKLGNISKIDQLSKLKYLNLSYCKINEIPSSLTKLPDLEILTISANQQEMIPPTLSQKKDLKITISSQTP